MTIQELYTLTDAQMQDIQAWRGQQLGRKLGFQQRETNAYVLKIREK